MSTFSKDQKAMHVRSISFAAFNNPKGETMDALCSAWQDCGNAYFQVVVIHTFLDGGDANRKLSLGTHGTV